HAPGLRLEGEVDRVGVGQRRGHVDDRVPVVIVVGLVLGHLAGGGVDVELVLGAVEDELELPFPGAVVVIDLDLHEIAAAHGLGRDLDRALGADRHLLGGEVRILRQRLGGLALRGVVGVLTVVGVGTRSLVGRLVVGPVLAGGAVGRTAVVRGSAVGAALVSGL